jgi:hypothetical protein
VILGLLSLPFRLLSWLLVAGAIYLGWTYRVELKRWIHRATADSSLPAPAPGPAPSNASRETLRARATAKLDSLAKHRVDSIVLASDEVEGLIVAPLAERAGNAIDSVTVRFGDGDLGLRGRVDPGRLPRGTLGPLAEWIKGRETVEAAGPFGLRRVGIGEWRVTSVKIRGLPVPKALWSRLLPPEGGADAGSVSIPLEPWVTGVRPTPGGLVLYGEKSRR